MFETSSKLKTWPIRDFIADVFKDAFFVALVSSPPGDPGEGPDSHFPKEIKACGPIPARIRGETHFLF